MMNVHVDEEQICNDACDFLKKIFVVGLGEILIGNTRKSTGQSHSFQITDRYRVH